jgi:hypothetical protein
MDQRANPWRQKREAFQWLKKVSASTGTITSMCSIEGNFLRSRGEGQYPPAHGVHMAPDDTMFLTIDGGHFVRKVTLDGAPMASRYCSKIVHPPSIR